MSRNDAILREVDLIRLGARRVPLESDYEPEVLSRVCGWVEAAGIPGHFQLRTSARNYEFIDTTEQLAVLLAGRLGDARVPPHPPVWPLLGILLLGWRESISPVVVMERAREAQVVGDVQRGLAIIVHLFPELSGWLADVQLDIPLWEKALALRVATWRLTAVEIQG